MNYIKKDWIFHKLGVAPINWSSWLQPIISLNHWGRILNVEQSCKRHCILSITKLKICIVISNHVFNWYSIQFHMHTSNISNIKPFNFLMKTSMWHSNELCSKHNTTSKFSHQKWSRWATRCHKYTKKNETFQRH